MDPNSTPSKEEVFPNPPGKSVHLSTDEQDLLGIETKGIQWGSTFWCPLGGHLSSDWLLGPSIPGKCFFNSRELQIRLSYFLWDTLFGPMKVKADHLTPPMFSPQSPTLAWDLEEETPKICEELWQIRKLLKIKKKMLGFNLETVLLGHR